MKERGPEERTFASDTFGRFALKHGITQQISPVDPLGRPVDASKVPWATSFITNLEKGGRTFTTELNFERLFRWLPSISDVLEYIANELAFFGHFAVRPKALARQMALDPGDPAVHELLEGLRSMMVGFRLFLGEAAFQEFLGITEARGPLPPGWTGPPQ